MNYQRYLWHEDLPAWIVPSDLVVTVPVTPSTVFPLIGANPQRVYLSVSSPPGVQTFIGLTNLVALNEGVQVGVSPPQLYFVAPPTFTGNVDMVTGDITGTFTFTSPFLRAYQTAPQRVEFTLDSHPALVQAAWWGIQGNPTGNVYLQQLLWENRPDEEVTSVQQSSVSGLWLPNGARAQRCRRYLVNPAVACVSDPDGDNPPSNVAESLLHLLRTARRR